MEEESTVLLDTTSGDIYRNRVEAKIACGGSSEYNRRWKNRQIIPILPSILKKASLILQEA